MTVAVYEESFTKAEKGESGMRPTKEMIIETKALLDRTDKSIQEIIKENDLKMSQVRHDKASEKSNRNKLLVWLAIIFSILIPFLLYQMTFK